MENDNKTPLRITAVAVCNGACVADLTDISPDRSITSLEPVTGGVVADSSEIANGELSTRTRKLSGCHCNHLSVAYRTHLSEPYVAVVKQAYRPYWFLDYQYNGRIPVLLEQGASCCIPAIGPDLA